MWMKSNSASLKDNQMLIQSAVELAQTSDLIVLALGENVLLSLGKPGERIILVTEPHST